MAPSPTGHLHIGTARATLFNYLFAKRYRGAFIMRIEDTDKERSKSEFEREILYYLRDWLGLHWDEGPYRQSERTAIYRPYLEQLLNEGKAFYCFHTDAELDAKRKKAEADGGAFLLRSDFRDLPLTEAKKMISENKNYIIRFKVHATDVAVIFDDLIRGRTSFAPQVIEDFAIAKDLDTPLYNFTAVVDDHLMEISHVIRGEDHISNTPKQLLLYRALGWDAPLFAHLPLILGPDRSKLSKRHGATSVAEFEAQGYLPEALINFMVLLGWNPGDEREIFMLADLEKEFSIEKVQKSGAIFNAEKLGWMNGQHIKRLPNGELAHRVEAFLALEAHAGRWNDFLKQFLALAPEKKEEIVLLAKDRMKKLADFIELSEFFFGEPVFEKELLRWKAIGDADIASSLEKTIEWLEQVPEDDFTGATLDALLKEKTKNLKDKGSVFWPLRVSLTGRKASPPPAPLMAILGKEVSLKRVRGAIELLPRSQA